MKIRNKTTGQIFEVLPGTLYAANIFEEVKEEIPAAVEEVEIRVGEPKVEFEIEETKEEPKKPAKKTKKTKKGAKKNGKNSTK